MRMVERRAMRCLALVSIAGWLASSAVQPAAARTFVVDSTSDAVDANRGDGICATAAGECTLRAGVNESNSWPGNDTVRLPAGTYVLTIPPSGIDASHAGSLNVDDRLTVRGAGPDLTIIDANGLDQAFAVGRPAFNDDPKDSLTLKSLTIRNGDAANGLGGAVVNFNRRLKLVDVTLRENHAGLGGAIDNEGGRLDVRRSRIVDNTGGSCCGGVRLLAGGRVRIVATEIRGNVSPGRGGGLLAFAGVDLRMTNSVVAENEAGPLGGGGMAFVGATGRILRSTFSANRAGGGGGGILKPDGGPLTIIKSELSGNEADADGDGVGSGGGIRASGGERPVLVSTVVTGNSDAGIGPDCSGVVAVAGKTVIGDSTGCVRVEP
jgi:hypothetical protein